MPDILLTVNEEKSIRSSSQCQVSSDLVKRISAEATIKKFKRNGALFLRFYWILDWRTSHELRKSTWSKGFLKQAWQKHQNRNSLKTMSYRINHNFIKRLLSKDCANRSVSKLTAFSRTIPLDRGWSFAIKIPACAWWWVKSTKITFISEGKGFWNFPDKIIRLNKIYFFYSFHPFSYLSFFAFIW